MTMTKKQKKSVSFPKISTDELCEICSNILSEHYHAEDFAKLGITPPSIVYGVSKDAYYVVNGVYSFMNRIDAFVLFSIRIDRQTKSALLDIIEPLSKIPNKHILDKVYLLSKNEEDDSSYVKKDEDGTSYVIFE